jgi:hypothetical protein
VRYVAGAMSAHPSQKPAVELPREPRLIAAALAGLLCLTTACTSKEAEASNTGGAAGAAAAPEITSSKKVEGIDAAAFKVMCDERHGTVEVMPHCGGFATARGFSYDTTNSMLSEHTCKGANTCAGWNCVTDE